MNGLIAPPPIIIDRLMTAATTTTTTTTNNPLNHHHQQQQQQQLIITRQPRKPSPGLAARLKALGIGAEKKQSAVPSPLNNDNIGRIPEDQIRQIDNFWQEKRGRAWSGGTTTERLIPQYTGGSWTSLPAGYLTPQFTGNSSIAENYQLDRRRRTVSLVRLSENDLNKPVMMTIGTTEEINRDHGQMYRLPPPPNHLNGNGTKAIETDTTSEVEGEVGSTSLPPTGTTPEAESESPPQSPPPSDESQAPPTPPLKEEINGAHIEAEEINGYGPHILQEPTSAGTDAFPEDEVESYFNPNARPRPGSIYTLSRVSFANQLAQLTSLKLPDADSLETTIAQKPTAHVANTTLLGIANTVRSWISRASDLLAGLHADDDVEWAAAGGREGLEEVDGAVRRFENFINVYVSAIEQLQARPDVGDVPLSKMTTLLTQTETVVMDWTRIRSQLKGVKEQVELAMEWEDIWNVVLGDISNEMGALNRLVFEIEEKRHKTIVLETSGGIDPAELDTIEDFPHTARSTGSTGGSNRFLPTGFPMSPSSAAAAADKPAMVEDDDSSLMALSARLQPLHASLTFVPIRLSTYVPRAAKVFPTACQELEERRLSLEKDWSRLKADADALQQELGEDKWIQVFRNANRSAERMITSIEKAIGKIKESFDAGRHLPVNPNGMAKKVDAYLKRKMHFGSAIEKVLIVIGNGLKDRLTVNGEIVRMHQDTQARWDSLREKLYAIDTIIQDLQQTDDETPQLRDSMSTTMHYPLDTLSLAESTTGSSPASSVIETPPRRRNAGSQRRSNARSQSGLPTDPGSASRRNRSGSGPALQDAAAAASAQKKAPTFRPPQASSWQSSSSTPSSSSSSSSSINHRHRLLPRPSTSLALDPSKPRWNSSVKPDLLLPLRSCNSTIPTPPAPKNGPPSVRSSRSVSQGAGSVPTSPVAHSKIPLRSSFSSSWAREPSSSPMMVCSRDTPPPSRSLRAPSSSGGTRKVSFTEIKSSPGPYNQQVLAQNRPGLRARPSMAGLNQSCTPSTLPSSSGKQKRMSTILPSMEQPPDGEYVTSSSPISPGRTFPRLQRRAASSMAASRRISMLPTPSATRGRQSSVGLHHTGDGRYSPNTMSMMSMLRARRESSLMSVGSGSGSNGSGDKPRWRIP